MEGRRKARDSKEAHQGSLYGPPNVVPRSALQCVEDIASDPQFDG